MSAGAFQSITLDEAFKGADNHHGADLLEATAERIGRHD